MLLQTWTQDMELSNKGVMGKLSAKYKHVSGVLHCSLVRDASRARYDSMGRTDALVRDDHGG
jgi:hypothetical protein